MINVAESEPRPRLPAELRGITFGRFEVSPDHLVLAALLLVGLAIRSVVVFERTNVVHPDEMFQYLEQGHRLAFGSGVVPWEYDYGIRSWFLPAVVALIMKACAWVSAGPLLYIYVLRFLPATLSLTVIVFGFRTVLPIAGRTWAAITGLFCATWFHAIFLAPALLTEVLAAYVMFPAVYLASKTDSSERTPLLLGFLLGLAFCLRFQMGPALAVVAAWYCRADVRRKWLPVVLTGSTVVLLIAGIGDALSLGSPFQSIWLNYYLNAVRGVSTNFGHLYWFRYLDYLTTYEALLAVPLAWLAMIGAYRAPLLALSSLTIVLTHSFFAHKEYRFVAFALLSLPILIGLGAAILTDRLRHRVSEVPSVVVAGVITLAVPIVSWFGWHSGFPIKYSPNTGVLRSFITAHNRPDLCGLGVTDYLWSMTGGYTYLDRNVPLYYSRFLRAGSRPKYYSEEALLSSFWRSRVPLEMHVELDRKPVTQFPDDAILANTSSFNYLVARNGRKIAGYTTVACFKNETREWPDACLLHRPGGCTEP